MAENAAGSNLRESGFETPIHGWRVQQPPNMRDILTRVSPGRSRIRDRSHVRRSVLRSLAMDACSEHTKFSSSTSLPRICFRGPNPMRRKLDSETDEARASSLIEVMKSSEDVF